MDKIFLPIYEFFHKRIKLMYAILIATTAAFVYFGLQVKYEEDISKLLPQTDAATESGLAFGDLRVKDKIFILFTSETADPYTMAAYSDEFFENLLQKDTATGYIDNVLYRIEDDLMVMGLDFALTHVPAFVDESCYAGFDTLMTRDAIERQMVLNAELVAADEDGSVSTMVGQDPAALRTALLPIGRELKEGMGGFAMIDGHLFTPDSTVALGFLAPSFKSFDSKSGNHLISMLEDEIDEFNAAHEDIEVLFHGAPVQSVFNSRKIKSDLMMTIGISLVLICILIGICMKGKSTLFMLLSPVVYGCFFALTCVYFIKGGMSLMAMGIGAIVLGVALSYCLHVLTHYKYVSDPRRVIREQATPVCLGCLTTIGAFAGLLFTESDLLRDFGIFASFAMVGTTLFALIFLPHFFRPETNRKSEKAFALLDRINSYPLDRKKPVLIFIVLLFAVCLYTQKLVVFDSDLKNIGYNEPKVMKSHAIYDEKNNHGWVSMYYASAHEDLDTAIENNKGILQVLDSLQNAGVIEKYSRTSSLFINTQDQEKRIEDWKNYWTPEKVEQARKDITAAAEKHDLNPIMFEPFYLMLESDYYAESIYDAGIIPENLMSNFIEKTEEKYMVFTSVLMPETAKKTVGKAVSALPGAVVIDPFFYTNDMVEILNNDFNTILGISSIFVFIVLLVSFRNFWISLIAFAPMSMSWIIVQGVMGIFGLQFNLINIIIATFIFGIGVDYSIFVMDGLIANWKGRSTELLTYHKTAILFSAIVLIVVVGSLVFAVHPAISSIGLTTLIGMTSTILITYSCEPFLFRIYTSLKNLSSNRHGKK